MKTVEARFPWALYLPLAALTAGPGILLVRSGYSIGWSAVVAPLVGLVVMRGAIRPRFELSQEGVVFRRGPRSPLLPWDEIDDVDPRQFTIATVPARFAKLGDLHQGIDGSAHSLDTLLEWAERDGLD